MIRTQFSSKTVPSNWIFEYYCNLKEKLHGQDIMITSVFNPHERTPSMSIFFTGKEYKFRDYSSGNEGDGIKLVRLLYGRPFLETIMKIEEDYKKQDKEVSDETVIKKESKYKVRSHVKRKWNELDAKFWLGFNIGSGLLNKYNVFPLEQYTLSKPTDNGVSEIIIKGQYIYGYFNNLGEIHKVYQPYRDKRFINCLSYVQGSEQLTYKTPTLIIASSLKDTMSLDSLGFNIESVSPSSENTMLAKSVLTAYSIKYKYILTLFDNDAAGHTGMEKYRDKYGIQGIHLKLSKDLSDSVRDFGPKKVKQYLTPLIPKT